MLVLSLDLYESLRIGDDILVVIHDINRKQVKLGIDAPDDVLVLREELVVANTEKARS